MFQRGGADPGGQAEVCIVRHGERLVEIRSPDDCGAGPEDLFAADARTRRPGRAFTKSSAGRWKYPSVPETFGTLLDDLTAALFGGKADMS
ncbi:MAG: hypothetical protein R3D53_14160 [Paracoccaceae bacterium]